MSTARTERANDPQVVERIRTNPPLVMETWEAAIYMRRSPKNLRRLPVPRVQESPRRSLWRLEDLNRYLEQRAA